MTVSTSSPGKRADPVVTGGGFEKNHNADLSIVKARAAKRGRGVLDGAFAVLEALANAPDGLGLTALARASGLAKTSAHRLAEQLVSLGAVQCVEYRYYV